MPLFKSLFSKTNPPDNAANAGEKLARQVREAGAEIDAPEHRFLRAKFLRHSATTLRDAMAEVHFEQAIHVRKDGMFVFCDGIFLSLTPPMNATDRYLKVPAGKPGNEGRILLDFLRRHAIEPQSIIDLGANLGEITLYFSKHCPESRILAVEPSSENAAVLRLNLASQLFDTGNVTVLHEAVSDRPGEVEISVGLGTQNSIAYAGTRAEKRVKQTERVKTDTLSSVLDRYKYTTVDFLKIDIEGAEPLLLESFEKDIRRIRSLCLEVGIKAAHEAYLPLVQCFLDSGMRCFSRDEQTEIPTLSAIQQLLEVKEKLDLWFVR